MLQAEILDLKRGITLVIMLKKKDVSFINLAINFIDATLNAVVPKKLTSKLFWSHVLKEMGHNKSLSSPSLSLSFFLCVQRTKICSKFESRLGNPSFTPKVMISNIKGDKSVVSLAECSPQVCEI